MIRGMNSGRCVDLADGTTKQVVLFGYTFAAATMGDVLERCEQAVLGKDNLMIGVANAAKIVKMRHSDLLSRAVTSSDVLLADGTSLVWASRILRRPLPERVAGIDLFTNLLGQAEQLGKSVYLLGARQDILDTMIERIRAKHPNLIIAGSRNGYFNEDEEESVAAAIRASNADYLFVGITSPKKERFLERWSPSIDVGVCHGVGGSFDVVAGFVERAPLSWQRLGLEWLYRVKQEPRRLWKRYLVTNTVFLAMLAKELVWPTRPIASAPSED